MMKYYNDQQNYLLNQLAYQNLPDDGWEPGALVVDLIKEPLKQQMIDAGLGDLVVVDYANNNGTGSHSGFCAIAFRNPNTGEVGMSFRGTENLDNITGASQVDMADNLMTALNGQSQQRTEALEFFRRNKSRYGDNYLYGHSKGGELASEVFAQYHKEVVQMHVINPQPINPYHLNDAQKKALKGDKVDVVIIDGDTVHSLGAWPYSDSNTRYVVNNGTEEGFFGPHMLGSASIGKDGNYEIEKHPFKNFPEQEAFNKLVRPLITAAQKGFLPKTSVFVVGLAAVYTFFARDIPAFVDKLKDAYQKMVKKYEEFKKFCKELAEKFNEFIDRTVTSIKNWWNSKFSSSYKQANANPYFTVNTDRLRHYADRLKKVNTRLYNLDIRMDTLYGRMGWTDLKALIDLMNADVRSGYSWRLLNCISYLNNTASDFEKAEREIASKL